MLARAYVADARAGAGLAQVHAVVARLAGVFAQAGAMPLEPPALLPAATLLDVYGEDIRGRAYLTRDAGGEQVLRPDFTVPLVEWYLREGPAPAPASYSYAGMVWRQQRDDPTKCEHLQAGVELFGEADVARADAGALAVVHRAVAPRAPLQVITGDLGLILAAVDGLETSAARRAALRRHVWRPARFQRLLDQFGPGHSAWIAARRQDGPRAPIGLRTSEDVEARLALLDAEAQTPPLAEAQIAGLRAVLDLKGTLMDVGARLPRLARTVPGLSEAAARFAARLDALAEAGHPPEGIAFEGTYGRTSLEYYDGFVFGLVAPGRDDLPVLASGGRYDRLLSTLGGGAGGRAVGGTVRAEALLAWERSC